jgi:3-oxoacyl-(acyl-carrier-protein) synthase
MTAPNSLAVQRCIQQALSQAGVAAAEIDSINGHLTATAKDAMEIGNWATALGRNGSDFPFINSFKSTTGHCLAAAGSIECVGSVLQFREQQTIKNINCEDLHPEIASSIDPSRVILQTLPEGPRMLAKASFGFGDVNACVIFKAYQGN